MLHASKLETGNRKNSICGAITRRMFYRGKSENLSRADAQFLWQIWPSKGNFIILRGACLTGHQPILLGIALVCAVSPFYSLATNPRPESGVTPSLLFLFAWFVITILLMLKVSFTDPGIIPRREVAERMYGGFDVAPHEIMVHIDPFQRTPGSIYCHTCEIHRPPNAGHCSECDNCVIGFDHHCAVLNNCVGQRNYPYFFALLPSITGLVVGFMFQIRFPSQESTTVNPGGWIVEFVSFVSVSVAMIALVAVVTLFAYHFWLLFVEKTTTKRHLRGQHSLHTTAWDRLCGFDALFDLRQSVSSRNDSLGQP
jgi:hypothetical protein